jgi:hypothetical protein
MSLEGWIFMVGFRVFDLGLLVLWLVWFFRLRDDGEDPPDDGGGGGGGPGQGPDRRGPRDGGGMRLPLGRWRGGRRLRDHGGPRRRPRPRGPAPPVPRPVPSRIRHPGSPVPAHTRR